MSTEPTMSETQAIDPSGGDGITFQCPFCGASFDHEWLTRVHITRTDDSAHRTHDGLMPETPVERLVDGEDPESITRHPDEIDLHALEPADLPNDLTTEERRIILTAAYNPYNDTDMELHERVESVFAERNFWSGLR